MPVQTDWRSAFLGHDPTPADSRPRSPSARCRSLGLGQNEGFVYQARAFLEEVAGIDEADSLPRCASFDEGVHNMEVLAAVAESAVNEGVSVRVPQQHQQLAMSEAGAR